MSHTPNRSFARRIGKALSSTQKYLLDNHLSDYLIDPQNPLPNNSSYQEVFLEIGIGMGEHFVTQAMHKPESLFLGFEPYLNGIANSIKLSLSQNLTNIRLWPDDADIALANISHNSLDGIYILFPDPWPKLKQQKRRFINISRLKLIYDTLKQGGFFIFASDIAEYFNQVTSLALQLGFININHKSSSTNSYYFPTKYHQKAELAGRTPQFIKYTKS